MMFTTSMLSLLIVSASCGEFAVLSNPALNQEGSSMKVIVWAILTIVDFRIKGAGRPHLSSSIISCMMMELLG
ncbi:hypothetical protein HDK77DRAFT_435444 [Phyllosticta capitalensis]